MDNNFANGFRRGLALWADGWTAELISHEADAKVKEHAEAYGRGMNAASQALRGWLDLAEREARAFGFTREEAFRLVGVPS